MGMTDEGGCDASIQVRIRWRWLTPEQVRFKGLMVPLRMFSLPNTVDNASKVDAPRVLHILPIGRMSAPPIQSF